MAFASGPVTFKRFFVSGPSPKRVTQELLDRIEQRAIGKGSVAAKDGSEAGWITGDHILDTKFDFAKNAIADCVHIAMRVDSNKPPSDIVRSYQKIHEQALLEQSGREFLSKQERREARDAAKVQAEKEAKAGRFRRMHQYPMLWDLSRNQVYLGATAPAVVDRFGVLFKETFGHGVTAATSGEMASRFAGAAKLTGAYDDLRPTQFTSPPEGAEMERSFAPGDEARSKDYLGTEWLIWVWYKSRHEEVEVTPAAGEDAVGRFEKSLQLDCAYKITGSVSLRTDDPSHSPEATAALTTGKLPVRAGMQLVHRGEAYACAVRGDVMHFGGVLLPASAPDVNNPRILFEERTGRLRDFTDAVEASYDEFLKCRLSSRWPKLLAAIRAWITTGASGGGDGSLTSMSAAS